MEGSDASSVSTSSDSVDFDEHNIWNPMLELLFHVQVGGIFEICVEEIDLAREPSCGVSRRRHTGESARMLSWMKCILVAFSRLRDNVHMHLPRVQHAS